LPLAQISEPKLTHGACAGCGRTTLVPMMDDCSPHATARASVLLALAKSLDGICRYWFK
jgi:hypothetical protein